MAEFCFECWNKINETNYPESKFFMSDEPGFCEECWGLKNVVICDKSEVGIIPRLYYFLVCKDGMLSRLKSRLK